MAMSPVPSFIPHSAADFQQIQLIQQVHDQTLPYWNMYLLSLLLPLPVVPIEWKLGIYNFLANIPFLSSLSLSPFWFGILMILGPIGAILVLALLIFVSVKLIQNVIFPVMLLLLGKVGIKPKQGEKTFLELTFPSDTTKSAFATEQLYVLLHTRARMSNGWQSFLKLKKVFSLEIVSSRDDGIRFLLGVPKKEVDVIHRSLLPFLPGLKVKEVEDYIPKVLNDPEKAVGIVELKLSSDFVLPLKSQKALSEHDPISFLIGQMTKLKDGELVAFQLVTTPILSSIQGRVIKRKREMINRITQGLPLTPILEKNSLFSSLPSLWWLILGPLGWIGIFVLKSVVSFGYAILAPNSPSNPINQPSKASEKHLQMLLNPYEQELGTIVKEKLDQHLFETSIRILVASPDGDEVDSRADELVSSFGQFSSSQQSLETRGTFPFLSSFALKNRLFQFRERVLSNANPILSSSEISDLYHFPYTDITKTEGLVKSRTKDLPAPLSMKRSTTSLDVILGANQYGGEVSPIGLTLAQRQKHMYVIGKTGTGKTTMLTSAIFQDMINGKGLAVFDPHGDMFQELLTKIPKNRRKDVIVFDPSDRDYPIGLNLLSPGIKFRNKEDEHDWIASSVLAVFKKLADEQYWGPRMEHILRNATLTALQTPNPNLYTLQRLLTEKTYQKKIALTLKDPVLKQFWQKEFALMGNMQLSAVTAPLTQRLGSFISSKMSRHILLQGKSSISISQIMDEGKILLVNLSKGDLGEDQSFFFGTILTSFIWMAAYQRTKIPESKRRDFFLYVDEFQNFATPRFSEITSEGRKFHVSLIASHQNIAQVKDKDILNVVAGNANTIVCLKASPDDEKFILPFMDPEVEKGDIVNLAPFNFFMKVTGDESEDAFSGKTVPIDVESSEKTKDEIISYTRKYYAIPRVTVEKYLEKLFEEDKPKSAKIKKAKTAMAKKPARRR
ncbi:MAG: type IV secretion system DNA-binding domain-containing protein [Candidatus Daviesbacteria bacterium]|nr:type IV secretion system DNA-binding domain-containing protein [Candidatus Daviesbacteria bacterium]